MSSFIYNSSNCEDTIAAIATPPGQGAIAIVRISGKQALFIADKIFTGNVKKYSSHSAHYGKILDENNNNKSIDSVLLLVMHSPKTYTGEDSVEIHCHGNTMITQKILQRVIQAGARIAFPGEFTFRAYWNKKIDLTQAEAVQELISAQNEKALTAAENQLDGSLFQSIASFQKEITNIAATIEAWMDFPEEDLAFSSKKEWMLSLTKTCNNMKNLKNTFSEGKMLREGLSLCIAGTPNVGKSSLMNLLLRKNRAIVTHLAGTTRDILEEKLLLNDFHFHLIDTAGIRITDEIIEQEGIKRSKKAMKSADIILLVLDASKDLSKEDLSLLENVSKNNTIVIWNKIDLHTPPCEIKNFPVIKMSATENIGIEDLKKALEDTFRKNKNISFSQEETVITKQRHYQALHNAITSCEQAMHNIESEMSLEFIASDLRFCLSELATIIGTNITEDILSEIFSKFCVGK